MCLLSNCPASEGSWPPPLFPPLLHPREHAGAFLLSHSLCRNSHSREEGQPGGGPHSPPARSVGLGRGSVSVHPPLFFLGARHWGAEGEILENSLEVKEFGSAVQAPPNPWPFLGMPLTSPAPLMERTALPWARPAPQRLPNDSLFGRSGSPGFQPASSGPGSCNSLPMMVWAPVSLTSGNPSWGLQRYFLRHKS